MDFPWLEGHEFESIQHPYAAAYNIPPSFEIGLPAPIAFKDQFEQEFGPSAAKMIGLDCQSIQQVIFDGLRRFTDTKLRGALRRLFDSYLPQSIVITKGSWLLRCATKKCDLRDTADLFVDADFFSIVSGEAQADSCIVGLSESGPYDAGRFKFGSGQKLDSDIISGAADPERWEDSEIVFTTCGGQEIIQSPSGEIGWFLMGQGVIYTCNFDLLRFSLEFVDHCLETGWVEKEGKLVRMPFDSYSSKLGKDVR